MLVITVSCTAGFVSVSEIRKDREVLWSWIAEPVNYIENGMLYKKTCPIKGSLEYNL